MQYIFQDIDEWMSGAGSHGVIYFSLGSWQQTTKIPEKYMKMFLEAFSKLPQKFLLNIGDMSIDLPKNVKTNNWLPQQDILGKFSIIFSIFNVRLVLNLSY